MHALQIVSVLFILCLGSKLYDHLKKKTHSWRKSKLSNEATESHYNEGSSTRLQLISLCVCVCGGGGGGGGRGGRGGLSLTISFTSTEVNSNTWMSGSFFMMDMAKAKI